MRGLLRRWLLGTELQVLRLRPGDEIVLTCPTSMTMEQVEELRARAELAWPGHRVIVLTSGVYLQAIRPQEGARETRDRQHGEDG